MICLTFNDLFIFQIVHCFIQASTMNEYFSAFLNLLCMYSVPFLVYLFVRFYLEQGVKLNMMPNAEPRDLEMVSLGKRLGESSDESSWDEEIILPNHVDRTDYRGELLLQNLEPGTPYLVKIESKNDYGWSDHRHKDFIYKMGNQNGSHANFPIP